MKKLSKACSKLYKLLIKYKSRVLVGVFISCIVFVYWKINTTVYIINVPVIIGLSDSKAESIKKEFAVDAEARIHEIRTNIRPDYVKSLNEIRKELNLPIKCNDLKIRSDAISLNSRLLTDISIETSDTNTSKVSFERYGFSIPDVFGFLRDLVGKPYIMISPTIKLEQDKYLVKVNAKYDNKHSYVSSELSAISLDEAKEKIAILLLEYIDPIIYANLMYDYSDSEVKKAGEIAVGQKIYKNTSSVYAILGNLELDVYQVTKDEVNLDRAMVNFQHALKADENNDIASLGLIMVKIVKLEALKKEDYSTLDAVIKNNEDLRNAAYLIYLKALEKLNAKKFESMLEKAIKDPLADQRVRLLYLSHLIKEENNEDINKYIQLQENTHTESSEIKLAKMFLELRDYESFESTEKIQSLFSKLNYCEKVLWLRYLDVYLNESTSSKKKTELENLALTQFELLEKGNFDFHFSYGNLLDKLGKSKEAIAQYKLAINYLGPKYQAYGNMAKVQMDIGDSEKKQNRISASLGAYKSAEEYAKLSLNLKETYQAVGNYLGTLYGQEKYTDYIHEFRKWRGYLKAEMLESNIPFNDILLDYAFSNCASGNMNEAENAGKQALSYPSISYRKLEKLEKCIGKPL